MTVDVFAGRFGSLRENRTAGREVSERMDADSSEWVALWPYGLLMIVLGVWAVHLFLAPSNWPEWVGAGLLQTFIVAQMYGFPLTLYFLKSIVSIDTALVHSSGQVWATLLGYGTFAMVLEMMLGSVLVMAGLFLIVKGWAEVYFRRDRLITEGVYGVVRHPQYAGIFLVIFGQLVHWPTIPTLLLAPLIAWFYLRLAKREERDLIQRFDIQYEQYREVVPRFVPGW
jgi:methanethiol S-methyltransferase